MLSFNIIVAHEKYAVPLFQWIAYLINFAASLIFILQKIVNIKL